MLTLTWQTPSPSTQPVEVVVSALSIPLFRLCQFAGLLLIIAITVTLLQLVLHSPFVVACSLPFAFQLLAHMIVWLDENILLIF